MCILDLVAGSAVVTCVRANNWLGVGSLVVLICGGSYIAFVDDTRGGCWISAC